MDIPAPSPDNPAPPGRLDPFGAGASARRRRESPLRWRVTRERFQLPEDEPPAGEPEGALRDVLRAIFKTIDRRHQPGLFDAICTVWPGLAGPDISAHARPGRLDRQTLVVFVDSAAWYHDLARFERPRLLRALQQRFGAEVVRDLRLQHDPEGPSGGRPPPGAP